MNPDFFNLRNYEKLINRANNIIRVRDYKKHNTGLILRHDVDYSLELAYEFSRLEKALGIKSSYYIRIDSLEYFPFIDKNLKRLKEMGRNGFEVGLHFNPIARSHVLYPEDLEHMLCEEMSLMESWLERKVYSYSIHDPGTHKIFNITDKFINAYHPDIFGDDRYISDSRKFSFNGKDPFVWIEKSNHRLIQFCCHPLLYFTQETIHG